MVCMHIGSSSTHAGHLARRALHRVVDAHVPERHGLDARLHLLGHARALPHAEDRLLRGPGGVDALRARAGRQAVGRAQRQQLRHLAAPPADELPPGPGLRLHLRRRDRPAEPRRHRHGPDLLRDRLPARRLDVPALEEGGRRHLHPGRPRPRRRPTSSCGATPSRRSASNASASPSDRHRRRRRRRHRRGDPDWDLGGEVRARAAPCSRWSTPPRPRGGVQPLVRARPLLRRLHDRPLVLRGPPVGRPPGRSRTCASPPATGRCSATTAPARTWPSTGRSRAGSARTPTGRPARCTGCTPTAACSPSATTCTRCCTATGARTPVTPTACRRAGARPPVPAGWPR